MLKSDNSDLVNPYITGSPVTGTGMFFGREDVFDFVMKHFPGQDRNSPLVLCGQPRIGKTSVLLQLHRRLGSGYRCIHIDFSGLDMDGMANLMRGIAGLISRDLRSQGIPAIAVPGNDQFQHNPKHTFEDLFLDRVWSVLGTDHLVLLMDEVICLDEKIKQSKLDPEVFSYFRHLMQHYPRLDFISSMGSVDELAKNYAFMFSPALSHRISFLETSAARQLVIQPVQHCYVVSSDAVDKILQITSGHPYYTQLVCRCVFDSWKENPRSVIAAADVDGVLKSAVELGSFNLTFVWEDSTPGEKALMAGMAVAMRSWPGPVSVKRVREAWGRIDVSLPESETRKAIRSLIAREVVITGDVFGNAGYLFAVDLQRLWLDSYHRHLPLVKDELGEKVVGDWRSSEPPLPYQPDESWGTTGPILIKPPGPPIAPNVPKHRRIRNEWRGKWSTRRRFLIGGAALVIVAALLPIILDTGNAASATWTYAVASNIYSSPAVTGGTVYFGSGDDVYAVSASTGDLKWHFSTGGPIESSPAVAGGVVYIGGYDGNVYALNADSGKPMWVYPTGNIVYSSPTVADGIVYVGGLNHYVYALNAINGRLKWKYFTEGDVYSSPAVTSGVVYIGSYDDNLYALNATSGRPIWEYKAAGPIHCTPAVADGLVYFGSVDGNVYALSTATGQAVWVHPTTDPIYSSPAVSDGTVYIGSGDDRVYALNAANGAVRWAFPTGSNSVYAGPAVIGNIVYVGSFDGDIYALKATTGQLSWKYQTGAKIYTKPAVADGTIYSGSRKLYALNAANGSAH